MDLSKYRITQAKGNHLKDHETDDAAGLRKGKEADALLAANIDDLMDVDGVGEGRARLVREGLSRLAESSILERYV